MEHSIRLKTEELNSTLIDGLKKYFKVTNTKEVVINFSTPGKKFLRHETQKETNARIEKAITDGKTGKSKWISFSGEEFEELSKALSKMNG
jgi:hypothetical protein